MDRVADVVRQSELRAALTWTVFGLGPGGGGRNLVGTLDGIRETHQTGGGRLRTFRGPHSPYICPPMFLETVVRHARDVGQRNQRASPRRRGPLRSRSPDTACARCSTSIDWVCSPWIAPKPC